MTVPRLEQFPDDNAKRDAVHFPVIPVRSLEKLEACARVIITNPGHSPTMVRLAAAHEHCDGFISPMIVRAKPDGANVWMIMPPGSTNDLRHNWSHPKIPDDEVTVEAMAVKLKEAEEAREEAERIAGDDSCRGCYE